jgi:hypothetical protein
MGTRLESGKNNIKSGEQPAPRKAGTRQVVATLLWGMCMIGKKGTWERDGATVTMPQIVVGAVIATIVVIATLVLLVRFATG